MIITPPLFGGKRRRKFVQFGPPPSATLNLVAAHFLDEDVAVELVFDRVIDLDGIDPAVIQVNDDQFTGDLLAGTIDGMIPEGNAVQINLTPIGVASGGQVLLTVSAANGIVASDDGGTWSGVTDLLLPFPTPPHDQIASVAHGDEEKIVVWLSNAVDSIALPGIEVSSNGVEWLVPESVNLADASNPVFTFAQDVSGATMWRVTDRAQWVFADGELAGAGSGEIG